MIHRRIVMLHTAAVLLLVLVSRAAVAEEPEPAFLQHLFSPELVMQHQSAIGLGETQREAISTEIRSVQAEVLEMQWKMHDAVRTLESAVEGDRSDADAATAAASRIFALEGEVKLRHLRLLLFIKEALTPAQREQLRTLRDRSAR